MGREKGSNGALSYTFSYIFHLTLVKFAMWHESGHRAEVSCVVRSSQKDTFAVGYADGWIRKLAGTEVLVGGKRRKIAGRVCMAIFAERGLVREAMIAGEGLSCMAIIA